MPRGQSIIEALVLILALWGLILCISIVGLVGQRSIKNVEGARFASSDCDVQPGLCRVSYTTTLDKMRKINFLSDRDFYTSNNITKNSLSFYSLNQNHAYLRKVEDVNLSLDFPKIDGADRTLPGKLMETFRGLALKAGPAIFGLSSPDFLTRTSARQTLWSSEFGRNSGLLAPSLETNSRVAMISDSWSASSGVDFRDRVKVGQTPFQLMNVSAEAFYGLGKDLLMPLMDWVGLEVNTHAFRQAFHEIDNEQVYANTRVGVETR